ncbi:MAG: hypothetical protein OEZ10_14010 [Gammaproteobacteria bacterium]|nr:hypothetical protein [Gammaproteobacteria bacterium]
MRNRFALIAVVASVVFGLAIAQDVEAKGKLSFNGNFSGDNAGVGFHRIVVAAPNVVPAFRAQIEKRFQNYVKKYSRGRTEVVRFEDVMPQKDSYSAKEVLKQLKANNFDGAVIIDIQQNLRRVVDKDSPDVMPSDMPKALQFAASHRHQPAYGAKYQPTTVRVFDLNSGKVVFEGSGFVNATPSSKKWHKLSGDFLALKLAKYLRKGSLLAPR